MIFMPCKGIEVRLCALSPGEGVACCIRPMVGGLERQLLCHGWVGLSALMLTLGSQD